MQVSPAEPGTAYASACADLRQAGILRASVEAATVRPALGSERPGGAPAI